MPIAHVGPVLHPRRFLFCAEALTSLTRLESAYLSRNPLAPASLSRLAPLHNL